MSIKSLSKRGIAIILSLAMLIGFVPRVINPVTVKAAGDPEVKSINLGTVGVGNPQSTGLDSDASDWSDGQGHYVYFGEYYQSDDSTKEPIKWRVLDKDGMLLLSDKVLENISFNPRRADGNIWADSNVKKWLNSESGIDNYNEWISGLQKFPMAGFLVEAFGTNEQAAIKATTKGTGETIWNDPILQMFGLDAPELSGEKVFLLSAEEADNEAYGFASNGRLWRKNTTTAMTGTPYFESQGGWVDSSGQWYSGNTDCWLRSATTNSAGDAGHVHVNGYLSDYGATCGDFGVAPALNLDLSSVILTSASTASKSTSFVATTSAVTNKEWKLTLKGTNDDLQAELAGDKTSVTLPIGYTAKSITINHAAASAVLSGATSVSALLADADGTVLYYGKINDSVSATSSTFTIPAGIVVGDYQLYVVAEDINTGNGVDYASALGSPIGLDVEIVDKTALEALVDIAEALTEADYTSATWDDLQDALTAAKVVLADDEAIQAEVDAAKEALRVAIEALELVVPVDKDILADALAEAAALTEADYTPETWADLDVAVIAGQTVYDDPDATQAEVDAATQAILDAIDALELVATPTVDKSILQAAVDTANALDEAKYTTASWSNLAAAVTAGQTVLDDTEATQAEVDAASAAVHAAIEALELRPVINKDLLAAAIAEAGKLDEAKYTPASWKPLADAVTAGQTIYGDVGATQAEVDAATKAILDAIANLKAKDTTLVDKSGLQSAVDEAKKLEESEYTPDSWKVLADALGVAQTVLGDGGATQAEVDAATKAIKDALAGLEKTHQPPTLTPTPTVTVTPTATPTATPTVTATPTRIPTPTTGVGGGNNVTRTTTNTGSAMGAKTGDETGLMLLIAMLTISGVGVTILATKKRRKNKAK